MSPASPVSSVSVMSFASSASSASPWILAVAAVCSAALVAGPVSAWTRRYVREPLAGYNDDEPEDAEDAPEGRPEARSLEPGPPARPVYPTLRHPGLLAVAPQGVLALALCGFCAWWGARLGVTGAALVAIPVYSLLASAASVDAVAHLLPNRLLGAAAVWLAVCGVVAVIMDPGHFYAARRAVLCALAAGGVSLVLALIRSGLGLGDVKLCALIGLWLGWYGALTLAVSLCLGTVLGGLAALTLLITRRAGRKDPMAYGPYLIAGALLGWPLAVV